MGAPVKAARREHREGIAVGRPEGQDHRDDRQDEGSGHANERVGGTHGAALHLAGLGHDGALELVERRVRGCAELLGGSLKLLARRRALLAALSGVRGLLTRRSISLSAARGGVLGLLTRLRAILRLAVALLLARRLGGVLPVGSGLRSSVLFRDNLSHGTLARPINDRTLKFLVRNRGGRGHGRFRQGRPLRLSNEGLDLFNALLGFVRNRLGLNDGLGFNDGSNSLNLRSTPRIRLHRLSLRSTPHIRLHGLSFHSGLNSSRLFNNRLSLLHHGSNSLNLGSTPRIRLHGRRVNNGSILNDRRGLNRRSFLCDGRRLDSGLFHGRGSLTVGIDRLRRGSDGSRLRNGRMSGNNTPVCQPLGKRRIQRRVRRHVGV